MEWVFELYRERLEADFRRKGTSQSEEILLQAFAKMQQEGSIKILVQEPWMGTIRFKSLALHKADSPDAQSLYENPMEFLRSRYGGGKFKVNFYHGMNFVATRNFKPEGEPLWTALPELIEE